MRNTRHTSALSLLLGIALLWFPIYSVLADDDADAEKKARCRRIAQDAKAQCLTEKVEASNRALEQCVDWVLRNVYPGYEISDLDEFDLTEVLGGCEAVRDAVLRTGEAECAELEDIVYQDCLGSTTNAPMDHRNSCEEADAAAADETTFPSDSKESSHDAQNEADEEYAGGDDKQSPDGYGENEQDPSGDNFYI